MNFISYKSKKINCLFSTKNELYFLKTKARVFFSGFNAKNVCVVYVFDLYKKYMFGFKLCVEY